MLSAKEAKVMSRENKMKIDAKRLERTVKEIEDKILVAVSAGWGYIGINPELSCISEVAKHFDALGYEVLIPYVDNKREKVYIVWDEEVWAEELGLEEGND